MSTLRGILIVFAVLLLAGIYWWGRRTDRKRRAQSASQLAASVPAAVPPATPPPMPALEDAPAVPPFDTAPSQPTVAVDPVEAGSVEAAPAEPAMEPTEAPSPPTHKILALRLVATTPRFSGAHVRSALEAEALVFGRYQIFHRLSPDGDIVFSVASMLEPGSFDLEQMFHQQYPGLALFAQLPGPLDGMTMLGELIGCARKLQQSLGGILQDEQGTPLLAFRIEQLRREVRDFEAAVRQSRPRSELPQP